ncbi:hypothetical protein ACFL59_05695 [Planctomycetota bacterium]
MPDLPATGGQDRFFIPRLGEWVLGRSWYEGALAGELPPPGASAARRWLNPGLLDSVGAARFRAAFQTSRETAHVHISTALIPKRAEGIRAAFDEAVFAAHPSPRHAVSVARLDAGQPSPLSSFAAWLGSREAASLHYWLAGWLLPQRLRIGVRVYRALAGGRIPLHVSTSSEGLAAVYCFTEGWQPGTGGTLTCYDLLSLRKTLEVLPHFNSMLLLGPRNLAHTVTEIPKESPLCFCAVRACYLAAASVG